MNTEEDSINGLDQALRVAGHAGNFKEVVRLVDAGAIFRSNNLQQKLAGLHGYFDPKKATQFLSMATYLLAVLEHKDAPTSFELEYTFHIACAEFRSNPKFLLLMRILLLVRTDQTYSAPLDCVFGNERDIIQQQLAVPVNQMTRVFADEYKLLTKMRFLVIKERATQICIALQELKLDANRICEIVFAACEPTSRALPFHLIWNLVVTVKHFKN